MAYFIEHIKTTDVKFLVQESKKVTVPGISMILSSNTVQIITFIH